MSKNSKNTITKANSLIDARYTLGLQTQKLLLACLSKYDPRHGIVSAKQTTISAIEYSEMMGISQKNAHRELYAAADALFKSSVILIENGHEVEVHWIQEKAKKISGEGSVTLVWSERMMRYISQIGKDLQYTSYKLIGVSSLQSMYSIRIYESLMKFKTTGHRIISVKEFREILGVTEKYKEFKTLSRMVIKPSIAELNKKCDFEITYETVLKNKKATALSFKFKRKSTARKAEEQAELDIAGAAEAKFIEELNEDSQLNHDMI